MRPSLALTLGVASAGAAIAAGTWAWIHFQRSRRKSPQELERLRRLEVSRNGRIAAGHIVDVLEREGGDQAPVLVLYKYEVASVTYEAAQDVSTLPIVGRLSRSLIGQTASIKYDPKQPTNSIIACEEWWGVSSTKPGASLTEQPAESPEKP